MSVRVASCLVGESIATLREGGAAGCEAVVVWLGRDGAVEEVYRPEQRASADSFHIGPPAMRALMARLRRTRLAVLAQLHSHPGRAFHSKADDEQAAFRHVGLLSLVLPDFALRTEVASFLRHVAAYRLSSCDRWQRVRPGEHLTISRTEGSLP